MLALLFVLCLLIAAGSGLAALLNLVGVAIAVVCGVAVLNVAAVILGAIVAQRRLTGSSTETAFGQGDTQRVPIVTEKEIRAARIPHLH
jgi:hypothetical protein